MGLCSWAIFRHNIGDRSNVHISSCSSPRYASIPLPYLYSIITNPKRIDEVSEAAGAALYVGQEVSNVAKEKEKMDTSSINSSDSDIGNE